MPSSAIQIAENLDNIEFAEFSNQLIDDVYSTIVDSQVEQTEAFIDLVRQTSRPQSEYIIETRDQISAEEIASFIISVVPNFNPAALDLTAEVANIPSGDLERYIAATNVAVDGIDNPLDADGDGMPDTNAVTLQNINLAAANRLASNRFRILTEMLRTGLVRLVVRDGEIETRLNFSTSSFSRT